MKTRLSALFVTYFAILILARIPAYGQGVITFDDVSIPTNTDLISITNGYQGFDWSNFWVLNVSYQTRLYNISNGDNFGMISASNIAFNGAGNPAEIDSPGTNFNFLSAYLTGAWRSNLNIEVQGFRNGALLYDTTVVASATNPILFTFNYLDIDRLYFNSFGGDNAGFIANGLQMVMDNFTFEFVPEPSSLLLAALGALALWPLLKRKREWLARESV